MPVPRLIFHKLYIYNKPNTKLVFPLYHKHIMIINNSASGENSFYTRFKEGNRHLDNTLQWTLIGIWITTPEDAIFQNGLI